MDATREKVEQPSYEIKGNHEIEFNNGNVTKIYTLASVLFSIPKKPLAWDELPRVEVY